MIKHSIAIDQSLWDFMLEKQGNRIKQKEIKKKNYQRAMLAMDKKHLKQIEVIRKYLICCNNKFLN